MEDLTEVTEATEAGTEEKGAAEARAATAACWVAGTGVGVN